jgi:hypothetical protein
MMAEAVSAVTKESSESESENEAEMETIEGMTHDPSHNTMYLVYVVILILTCCLFNSMNNVYLTKRLVFMAF